ncbi:MULTISPECIES: AraC family transcriptional regulator [unclassified Brevundimonas]|uniref:AraC family transcriptional regulator n=1 Tax=unclassified Brevundimonas TaxID=2622653 RepID=UPI003F8FED54
MTQSRTIAWDVSTSTLPDALERYLIGMADLYEVSGISAHDRAHFFNRTRTTLSAVGGIGEGRSVRQTLSRSGAMLRRSNLDGLNLLLNRSATVGDCDGRSVRAEPGALQFRDMGRVSSSRLDSVDVITLMIPRNLAPPPLLAPDLHGLALPPNSPGVRLVGRHMRVLADEAEHLPDAALDTAIQALLLIAGRIAGIETPIGGPELAALQGTVRRAAVDYIELRLTTPEIGIDVDAVAAAAGVSRATLYRSFDGAGGVKRYIQDRRLHHARAALRRRQGLKPTIADIAWTYGFMSQSHFNRLFRERYGYPPSDVCAPEVERDIVMSDGPIRHDLLSAWLTEIGDRRPI